MGCGSALHPDAVTVAVPIALVDCNNFYVSCERAFDPSLRGRPVVVLSNNDGCAISRSNEAKDLGVRMAQPWFEVRHLERTAGLVALSANFELYGDMSARMMSLAARYAPRQEIYSIDECFLDFDGLPGDPLATGRDLRAQVLRWTGLPTSVGSMAVWTERLCARSQSRETLYPFPRCPVPSISVTTRPSHTTVQVYTPMLRRGARKNVLVPVSSSVRRNSIAVPARMAPARMRSESMWR